MVLTQDFFSRFLTKVLLLLLLLLLLLPRHRHGGAAFEAAVVAVAARPDQAGVHVRPPSDLLSIFELVFRAPRHSFE
jgi:hypothetical protein